MNYYSGALEGTRHFNPDDEVIPGVKWGREEWLLSPAYWVALAAAQAIDISLFRKPDSLLEEIAFCLLGGFGITAEVNCAAFRHLKDHGVFLDDAVADANRITALLQDKISVEGSLVRYRFPNQRAARLAKAIKQLRDSPVPSMSSRDLRNTLLTFDGIGPKTASWIARNWLDADDVAIIDIHVHRAGLVMGLFSPSSVLPKDYFDMEERFLNFAERISVRASVLDALIWANMRKLGNYWQGVRGG